MASAHTPTDLQQLQLASIDHRLEGVTHTQPHRQVEADLRNVRASQYCCIDVNIIMNSVNQFNQFINYHLDFYQHTKHWRTEGRHGVHTTRHCEGAQASRAAQHSSTALLNNLAIGVTSIVLLLVPSLSRHQQEIQRNEHQFIDESKDSCSWLPHLGPCKDPGDGTQRVDGAMRAPLGGAGADVHPAQLIHCTQGAARRNTHTRTHMRAPGSRHQGSESQSKAEHRVVCTAG